MLHVALYSAYAYAFIVSLLEVYHPKFSCNWFKHLLLAAASAAATAYMDCNIRLLAG